jgi:hypothetical protein
MMGGRAGNEAKPDRANVGGRPFNRQQSAWHPACFDARQPQRSKAPPKQHSRWLEVPVQDVAGVQVVHAAGDAAVQRRSTPASASATEGARAGSRGRGGKVTENLVQQAGLGGREAR